MPSYDSVKRFSSWSRTALIPTPTARPQRVASPRWLQGSQERALVAYARIFRAGVRYDQGSIGRVVTAGEVREPESGRL
jgi:hypothetical protein